MGSSGQERVNIGFLFHPQERAEKELEKLKNTIALKEGELEKLKPMYEEEKRKEEEYTRE